MLCEQRPENGSWNNLFKDQFTRRAPLGKFRIIGFDTFVMSDWFEGDFNTLEEAKAAADKKGRKMIIMYVYDETGKRLHSAGTF